MPFARQLGVLGRSLTARRPSTQNNRYAARDDGPSRPASREGRSGSGGPALLPAMLLSHDMRVRHFTADILHGFREDPWRGSVFL